MFDPQQIQWKLVPREDVELLELIWRMSDYGKRLKVETDKDWKVIEGLINIYFSRFSYEANDFIDSVKKIKASKSDVKGYSKNREILHIASLPIRLQKMIKVCFPQQQFDKKFIYGMIKRIPGFKIGGK